MSEAEIEATDDVRRAIQAAKVFLQRAFQDENVENLGLEEVKHSQGTVWDVTLSFNRRWDAPAEGSSFLQMAAAAARSKRSYKVVKVDLDGPRGISITNREDD